MTPLLLPLGDSGLLIRFADVLTDEANRAAVAFSRTLDEQRLAGVVEVVPGLVSVLLRLDTEATSLDALAGEVRLRLSAGTSPGVPAASHKLVVTFGGEAGPDLPEVAQALGLSPEAFVERHNAHPLRVLATGFAPGFVYCGFHRDLVVSRRVTVRRQVPAGSVLFAAGQTAICATVIPTGWHVIGRTTFANFSAGRMPPTTLVAGDTVTFEAQAS